MCVKGQVGLPNRMNFRKSSKGGGDGHFQSKNYIAGLFEVDVSIILQIEVYISRSVRLSLHMRSTVLAKI